VAALKDRAAALKLLEDARAAAPGAAFVQSVWVDRVRPDRLPPVTPDAALSRLKDTVKLRAERAVIYVEALPVVALPSREEAERVLQQIRSAGAPDGADLKSAPHFKEQVEVRVEPAEQDAWADAETATALLKGEGGEQKTVKVGVGDTAWSIAERSRASLAALERSNPGTDLQHLRAGQVLKLSTDDEKPLLTVLAEAETTRTEVIAYGTEVHRNPKLYVGKTFVKQPGKPGRARVTRLLKYENGRVVEQQVVRRSVLAAPRSRVVVIGALPRR
jgi:LysM repeat protein